MDLVQVTAKSADFVIQKGGPVTGAFITFLYSVSHAWLSRQKMGHFHEPLHQQEFTCAPQLSIYASFFFPKAGFGFWQSPCPAECVLVGVFILFFLFRSQKSKKKLIHMWTYQQRQMALCYPASSFFSWQLLMAVQYQNFQLRVKRAKKKRIYRMKTLFAYM